MKRHTTTLLGAALVALSAGAWAADTSSSTPPAPNAAATTMPDAQQGTQPSVKNMDSNAQRMHGRSGQKDPSQQGVQPSAQNMDANAQRAHSRSQGTEPGSADAAQSKGMTGGAAMADASGGSQATRDWSQVDTNHDNSVSPDEMQKFLDQQPSRSKSGSKSSDSGTSTGTPPTPQAKTR